MKYIDTDVFKKDDKYYLPIKEHMQRRIIKHELNNIYGKIAAGEISGHDLKLRIPRTLFECCININIYYDDVSRLNTLLSEYNIIWGCCLC